MYKITVLFESNIEGIYTKEEETADNEKSLDMKFKRMAERWVKNMLPYLEDVHIEKLLMFFPFIDVHSSLLPIYVCDELNESFMKSVSTILKIKLYQMYKHIELLNACDTIPNTRKRKFSITISKI